MDDQSIKIEDAVLAMFLDLVKIPSPSGGEKDVAAYIVEKMLASGFSVWSDNKGGSNASNSGNIYAYYEVNKDFQTLMFSAHMDTVQGWEDVVVPIVEGGSVKSDGSTVLGADDKAGVAVLLAVSQFMDKTTIKNNVLFYFPTREEAGVMGSSLF